MYTYVHNAHHAFIRLICQSTITSVSVTEWALLLCHCAHSHVEYVMMSKIVGRRPINGLFYELNINGAMCMHGSLFIQ